MHFHKNRCIFELFSFSKTVLFLWQAPNFIWGQYNFPNFHFSHRPTWHTVGQLYCGSIGRWGCMAWPEVSLVRVAYWHSELSVVSEFVPVFMLPQVASVKYLLLGNVWVWEEPDRVAGPTLRVKVILRSQFWGQRFWEVRSWGFWRGVWKPRPGRWWYIAWS